jgi:cytochrome d ubiquinol oxidase subunit I
MSATQTPERKRLSAGIASPAIRQEFAIAGAVEFMEWIAGWLALTLSRIQFAWVIAWHILLPAFTGGIASWAASHPEADMAAA